MAFKIEPPLLIKNKFGYILKNCVFSYQQALMDEIKARVSSRRPPSPTSFDVTAQMNLYPILDETSSNQSEPVRGRIGQLPPNARSSFQRKSVDPILY